MNRRSFLRSIAVAPLGIPAIIIAAKVPPEAPGVRSVAIGPYYDGQKLRAMYHEMQSFAPRTFIMGDKMREAYERAGIEEKAKVLADGYQAVLSGKRFRE